MTQLESRDLKVLLYADFRSPHAKAWADGMDEAGVRIVRLSSHQVQELKDQSSEKGSQATRQRVASWLHTTNTPLGNALRWLSFRQWIHSIFYLLITSRHEVTAIKEAIEKHKPDLIHSLRIPYESVSVMKAKPRIPWIVSTWGQDFVPQASTDWILRRWTRKVLRNIDSITYDSRPDYDRALGYGLDPSLPKLYCAGNLGVNTELFYDDGDEKDVVLYPRKISSYSNYWGFLAVAARLILKTEYKYVAVGLSSIREDILKRYPSLNSSRFVTTNLLTQEEYAEIVRKSKVVVSPNYSDGTPNSILEALASGANVVAGRLPQLVEVDTREEPSILLVDPRNDEEIESAIIHFLVTKRKTAPYQLRPEMDRAGVIPALKLLYSELVVKR